MRTSFFNFKVLMPIFALFLFSACDSVKRENDQPMRTVLFPVDLSQFQGTWHVAARMPSFFEKDCQNSRATYTPTSQPGVIEVLNECEDINDPGKTISTKGFATTQNSNNSQFEVTLDRFPGNLIKGKLWVLHLDEQYQWAIVSEPEGRYLWIMGREETMDEPLLSELVAWAQNDGWDTSALLYQ